MTMRYGTSLYADTEVYQCHTFKTRNEWLSGRKTLHGIGGSDASAAIGRNPYRTNLDLWLIKTGQKEAPDISDNERVQYGQNAEEYIRRIYQLKNKDRMEVQYVPDAILQNRLNPEFLYSPDGLLIERETGRKGIFECKTSTLLRSIDKERWDHQIPPNYYIQVLHGLNTTGFDFVDLYAELTYDQDYSQLRRYHIERNDCEDDLQMIAKGVKEFMAYVIHKQEPPLILNI